MLPSSPTYTFPSAEELEGLLEMLYPDPPLVDIITLTEFKFRYRFSGLGVGAVAAMERAQRITRAIGNYDQMGLSEFYNGLIYLHDGQFLGAWPCFAEARRYWDFDNRATAVCLAQFAQGVAQHGAFHYELALNHYGKADRCMARFPIDDVTGEQGPFWRALRTLLAASRQSAIRQLRLIDEGPDSSAANRRIILDKPPVPPPSPPPTEEDESTAVMPPPEQQPVPRPASTPAVDLPIFKLSSTGAKPVNEQVRARSEDTEEETAVPFIPIPGHDNHSPYLIWMKPEPSSWEEVQAFLPDIHAEDYILVDRDIENYIFKPGDLIIVDNKQGAGSVPVEPQQPPLATRFPAPIYLGKIERPPNAPIVDGPEAANTANGRVRVSLQDERPLYAEDIIGIVVGIWLGLAVTPRPSGTP
ncbi:MAG: hypothetical protein IPM76_13785 [Chloroflexi bacterium]|nr:hypothetical protein [Chloroflexota bacterium]